MFLVGRKRAAPAGRSRPLLSTRSCWQGRLRSKQELALWSCGRVLAGHRHRRVPAPRDGSRPWQDCPAAQRELGSESVPMLSFSPTSDPRARGSLPASPHAGPCQVLLSPAWGSPEEPQPPPGAAQGAEPRYPAAPSRQLPPSPGATNTVKRYKGGGRGHDPNRRPQPPSGGLSAQGGPGGGRSPPPTPVRRYPPAGCRPPPRDRCR